MPTDDVSLSTLAARRRAPVRYWAVFGGLLGLLLVMYALVEALRVPLLTDAGWLRDVPTALAALGAFGLLVVDVVLPVPASVVMVLNGALFGVTAGAMISLAGGIASSLLAFALGRRSRALVARWVSAQDRARSDRLLARWGATAVLVTRPVPILAEAVAFMAGASPLALRPFTLATIAGTLPAAALYAVAGAAATDGDPLAVLAVGLVLAVPFWLMTRRSAHRHV